jgi:hypothetical protein
VVIEYRKFSPERDGSEVWDRSFSMYFCVEPGYCPLGELAEGVVVTVKIGHVIRAGKADDVPIFARLRTAQPYR